MRILLLNPNTSASMTAAIDEAARAAAGPGTTIVTSCPHFGAEAIDAAGESYLSAVGVMDKLARQIAEHTFDFDAVILAGFGEHGKDALQEMVRVPVFDIAECAVHVAHLVGRRYSVVTTLACSIPAIEDRLLLAGLAAHCASIRACGIGTAELDADPPAAVAAIVAEAARAVADDRADVIVLGCAGMAEVAATITAKLGVPTSDGVAAAVGLAEAVVRMGLCHHVSPLPANPRSHWPLSPFLTGPR